MAKKRKKWIGMVGGGITEEELKTRAVGFELWSVNNLYGMFPESKFGAWFEIHQVNHRKGRFTRRGYYHYPPHGETTVNAYLKALDGLGCPVYMMRRWARVKQSRPFPFDALIEKYGHYWGCSFAWMTAFAIEQGATRIGYFGVALDGNEYYYQRPSTEYMIGRAAGRGIDIYIDESSGLLKGGYMYALTEDPDVIYMLHGQFTKDLTHVILTAIQQRMEEIT